MQKKQLCVRKFGQCVTGLRRIVNLLSKIIGQMEKIVIQWNFFLCHKSLRSSFFKATFSEIRMKFFKFPEGKHLVIGLCHQVNDSKKHFPVSGSDLPKSCLLLALKSEYISNFLDKNGTDWQKSFRESLGNEWSFPHKVFCRHAFLNQWQLEIAENKHCVHLDTY